MNKVQLVIMWLAGLIVSGILYLTGSKLLAHAASSAETWETGYPITLLAGTVWTYVIPVVIIGAMLMITFRDNK